MSIVGVVPDTLGAVGAVMSSATVKDVTASVFPLTPVLLVPYSPLQMELLGLQLLRLVVHAMNLHLL